MGDLLPAFEIKKKNRNKQTENLSGNVIQAAVRYKTWGQSTIHRYSLFLSCREEVFGFTVLEWHWPRCTVTVWNSDKYWNSSGTSQEQPAVIPSCCSRQFYPPAERESEKYDSQNLMKYARILIHRKAFWHARTRNCRVQIHYEQQRPCRIWEQRASTRNKEVVSNRKFHEKLYSNRFPRGKHPNGPDTTKRKFSDVWSWTKTLKNDDSHARNTFLRHLIFLKNT